MTKFPDCFRDEGQPPRPAVPWPSWRGLPLLLHSSLMLPICHAAAPLNNLREWLCAPLNSLRQWLCALLLYLQDLANTAFSSHVLHLLPAPPYSITPTHTPDSHLDAASAGDHLWSPSHSDHLSDELQEHEFPHQSPDSSQRAPGLNPGLTGSLLCDLGWLTLLGCFLTYKNRNKELPVGLVVWTLCFHCQGAQFDPWSENWDPITCVVRPVNK